MKGAGKGAGIATELMADWHVTMAADVEQRSNLAVFATNDNHRLVRQLEELEVSDIGEFILLRNVEPGRTIHAVLELP
jgi:hypothetical protein